MEEQPTLQLDLIDNGLAHNGNNLSGMEISDAFQTQKTVDHSMEVDGSDDITKKIQNSANGVQPATEPIDNHQDDDLIRELEQFEGAKKDDDVALPKPSVEENGSNLQDTSDLLKDLESDSPCPGPSESEIAPIDAIIAGELMEVDTAKKSDDGQVDSTTQSSNKRKCSSDGFADSAAKRPNIENATEKSNVPDASIADTQKSTSEIDSDTELKLLQENSDGEASMSDVVEAITSTSAVTTSVTTTPNDVKSDEKLVAKTSPSNEDPVVSSTGNVDIKDVQKSKVSKGDAVDNLAKSTAAKGDDEVSSNKLNDTTEVMEQDLNETLEADRVNESDKSVTTNAVTAKSQAELPALDKTSETVASSQPDPVDSSESEPTSMQIDADTKSQSNDATQKCNGLSSADPESIVDSKTAPDSETLPDSGKPEETPEPTPVERIFDIRMFYDGAELKSLTVERSEQSADVADASSEPTKHTVNGVVELCNFMIDHFSAIKQSLNVDDASTPKGTTARGRGSAKKNTTPSSSTTPKAASKRGSTSKRSLDVDSTESKSKQTKSSKPADDDVAEEAKGDCCLARWTDRKYYAGRVIEEKPGNKFAVLFEDGATKTLSAEVIVFGNGNILPLMDHSVHVLVAEETYEPGIVTKVDSEGEQVMYTVAAESKTVTCTSSNIYLMEDQAKVIISSIKSTETMKSPETPSSKRTGRLPAKLEETVSGRLSRGGKKSLSSPEPGTSGDAKPGRRPNKR